MNLFSMSDDIPVGTNANRATFEDLTLSKHLQDLPDDAVSERLLDLAKGRLDDKTAQAIEKEAGETPSHASELSYYKALASAAAPVTRSEGHDALWDRISDSIDEIDQDAASPPKAANDNTRIWQAVAAALGLAVIVQGGILANQTGTDKTPDGPIYIPVADSSPLEAQILFQPDATSADLVALINQFEGDIVAGPSAIGLYTVRFETEAARDEAVDALRLETDIVDTVTRR